MKVRIGCTSDSPPRLLEDFGGAVTPSPCYSITGAANSPFLMLGESLVPWVRSLSVSFARVARVTRARSR
jgi:hypothetical protein